MTTDDRRRAIGKVVSVAADRLVVELHGGTIALDGCALGGLEVRVVLPRDAAAPRRVQGHEGKVPACSATGGAARP